MILEAEGIPILAHPLTYALEPQEVKQLMQTFASTGGLAVEAFYGKYSAEERALVQCLANECHPPLLYSAASDFHSWESGTLDYRFPAEEILPLLMNARKNRKGEF